MASSPGVRRLAFVLALAALCGCNSGSDGDQLTADEYRERGNRICREAERDAERLESAGIREQLDLSADAAEKYQRQLKQLKPPDELREKHDQAVQKGREAVDLLRRAQEAAAGERPGTDLLELVDEFDRVVREGNAIVRELGLTDCVAES
jgi:hypothetical protein